MSLSRKLTGSGTTISLPIQTLQTTVGAILRARGLSDQIAQQVALHLVQSDLAGVASHGCFRVIEYARQFDEAILDPTVTPVVTKAGGGATILDGRGGIGIPAMQLATEHLAKAAVENGMAALGVRNCGHTGRIGAFAQTIAMQGQLAIIIGGGGRKKWRQVAPYGGKKALLPTNPYAMAMPGGDNGPVVLDFATASIAGGWIYAAKATGAKLPEGALIDAHGKPTVDPNDYFEGGAILPFGGPKGSAMSVMAEMIGEAMLGPSTTECQWLMISLDTSRFRAADQMQAAAEDVLAEIRTCPPAQGFDRVAVPGEKERESAANRSEISLPTAIWDKILAL